MDSLARLKLKPGQSPEGFGDEFEVGRNCARIQHENGTYYVFRPRSSTGVAFGYDFVITPNGHGYLQWREQCSVCGELFPGSKQLASHLWHRHKVKKGGPRSG